ncbi:MAG: hypothetical protein ABJP02_04850 [Parasphingorhabdus sp.]|uniref:hypothetical protein n=1 Tax=Parasphingorhabdus sp. TaxID=2709688 RepID=UPI0032979DE7
MGKFARKVLKVAAVAVQFIPGIGQLAAAAITIGLTILDRALAPKNPQVPQAQRDRLFSTIDPSAFRKTVLGSTAMATDIRYEEWSGTNQEYLDRIIACASHKVHAIRQIWIEDKLAWTSSGGVTSTYAGYLTVQTRLEGNAGNTISINGGSKWGTSRRLTGCAYVHMRFKTTGNSKKAESPFAATIPQRLTIVGDGALLYDPRLDSSVGGSGPQRADDQSTWAWTSNAAGNNAALHILFYLLGWRINGKLAIGRGVPKSRFLMAAFIAAANMCEENVSLAAGGQEPRYRSAGVISENDNPEPVLEALASSCAGTLRDASGFLALDILHNDLATPVASFTDDDILDQFNWQATRGLDESFNLVRGRRTDASNNGLYQLVDYPAVSLPSPDGLERAHTFDLSMVQSASQAQRLAKQELQRAQYQGVFSAEYKMTALRCQVGDVIEQTFSALGFVNKLFRVTEQVISMNGRIAMTLREENAAIYAWSEEESAAVEAADPTVYDPLNSPLIQAILTAEQTADWSAINDDNGGKPDDNADVTAFNNALGFIGEGVLARLNAVDWSSTVNGRPAELTDGRISAGFNSSGELLTAISNGIGSLSVEDLLRTGLAGNSLSYDPSFERGTIPSNIFRYDNNASGSVSISIVQDASAPKGNSNLLRVAFNNSAQPSPGCGMYQSLQYAGAGQPSRLGRYTEGSTIAFVLLAKIPVGKTIEFTSNATGTGAGGAGWLTSKAGTGNWEWYIYERRIGVGGTLSSTGFFYVTATLGEGAFHWDIAKYDQIELSSTIIPALEHLKDISGNRLVDTDLVTLLGNAAGFVGEGLLARLNAVDALQHISNADAITGSDLLDSNNLFFNGDFSLANVTTNPIRPRGVLAVSGTTVLTNQPRYKDNDHTTQILRVGDGTNSSLRQYFPFWRCNPKSLYIARFEARADVASSAGHYARFMELDSEPDPAATHMGYPSNHVDPRIAEATIERSVGGSGSIENTPLTASWQTFIIQIKPRDTALYMGLELLRWGTANPLGTPFEWRNLRISEVTPSTLAQLDADQDGKLNTVEINADVTANSVPFHGPASKSFQFSANHLGVLDGMQLPATSGISRYKGDEDVSSTANFGTVWTIENQGGITGATVTVANGIVTIPLGATIPKSGDILVKSARDGFPLFTTIPVSRDDAAAPTSGGGVGGTSASDNSLGNATTTSFVAISDELELQTGANGEIQCAGGLSIIAAATNPEGTFGAALQWRIGTSSGSLGTNGAILNDSAPAVVFYDGEFNSYFGQNGSISASSLFTGLTPNTTYYARLYARRDSASPPKIIGFGGSVSATGS